MKPAGRFIRTPITRPANATPYTTGDVLGGVLDLGVLGPRGGGVIEIDSVQFEYDVASVPSGLSVALHLYGATPPSAFADNAVWSIPAGDRALYRGSIAIGAPATVGGILWAEQNNLNKVVGLSGTHLFGYLVTAGFTPAGNSEVLAVAVSAAAK